jgi:proteic killer suppression protein
MIKSYRNKGLELFGKTGNARKLSVQNPARIRLILAALEAAQVPGDMNLPGLRFHPLGKMDPGRYAVEASGNWRVTFAWAGADAVDVDLEDYH